MMGMRSYWPMEFAMKMELPLREHTDLKGHERANALGRPGARQGMSGAERAARRKARKDANAARQRSRR